jgi:sugar phosphate permease
MLIQGLAQSTGWSGLCKNLGSFFPSEQRGRVLGLWSSCYAFGGLVASPFAGWWAYTLIGTWHAAFFSSAAVVGLVAVLFFIFQRNKPEDVGLPAVEPEPQLTAQEADAQSKISILEPLKEILRNRTVLVLGLAYFLLKPARYAILLWGPVIVFEQMPSVGKVGAAIIPTAFELAGLLGPILLGLASDSMISGAAAIDFGTAKAGATAAGFVNGCGSVGAILGGLLPGYFDSVTVFIVFAGCALFSALVLLPHWNSRPAGLRAESASVPNQPITVKPLRT